MIGDGRDTVGSRESAEPRPPLGAWRCGAVIMAIAAAAWLAAGSARAEVITGAIIGSGINADLSTAFQRDSNWKIVAVPDGFTPPDSQALGYNAYVPRTVNAVGPTGWLGGNTGVNGSQGGYSVSGTSYYWISPNTTVNAIVIASATNPYNWIAAQTFTVPRDDLYFLNFPSAVDNRLGFFVNGSIDATNPRQPVIVGGFQIGTTSTATGQFRQITDNFGGPVFLATGTTHTAYMVLTDLGGDTGVLIGPSVFSTVPVPEPSACVMAATVAAGLARLVRRRRPRCPPQGGFNRRCE